MKKMIAQLKSYQNGVHGSFFLEVAAELERLEQVKELIDFLKRERPAFAEDLNNGHDLISMHEGHFVAWDEIIEQCKSGLDDVGYSQSPAELITRIIDERDELRGEVKRLSLQITQPPSQTCPICGILDQEPFGPDGHRHGADCPEAVRP